MKKVISVFLTASHRFLVKMKVVFLFNYISNDIYKAKNIGGK